MPGKELLHSGLFEVALLGDQAGQAVEQRIYIRQGGGDGALFFYPIWNRIGVTQLGL
ncbi:MAG TPA: hypothetical protein PLS42_14560 [Candidatus Competibacter denitrificans]|uniref:hypothetical protein n=1 Tax=Candidatus Competibacter denitrificans TaxID=1400862 RepID=UPI0014947292|nr:hypothetical protein [Candidatus Competibacter denitrificans]HRC70862.1 hypothetical protein [Candidatus Competibacter denitrificans]